MSISPFELLRYCYWISLDIISYYAIAIGASPTRLIARLRCAALRCAALRYCTALRLCAALHAALHCAAANKSRPLVHRSYFDNIKLRCAALHAALHCAAANKSRPL
jgi:hypothetical protein